MGLHEKYGSIPLSTAVMKERIKRLGHVLRVKSDRLPKMVFSSDSMGLDKKLVVPNWVVGDHKKGLNRNCKFIGECNNGSSEQIGMEDRA